MVSDLADVNSRSLAEHRGGLRHFGSLPEVLLALLLNDDSDLKLQGPFYLTSANQLVRCTAL